MSSKFRVDGTVKEGDYFTFVIPENLTVDGDIDYSKTDNSMKLVDIKNANGDIVAKGEYNVLSKNGRYIFTNYVNDKENINGFFELPLWTDRKITPYSGNYDVQFDIANQKFNSNIDIDYGNPSMGLPGKDGANVSSFITKIDNASGERTYKQTIYVNSKNNNLRDTIVTLQGYHNDPNTSSTVLNKDVTKFKVYKLADGAKVTDSYYIDPNSSNYIDVTNGVLPYIYDNGDNTITFNFGDINETYIITVDGQYDDSGENVKTRVTETNSDIYGVKRKSYYWDNENIIRTGDGGADGDNRQKYKLGNYVWHDID
ncbi:fibrinogen-binding adhesin SdrG C-terminal domain-containing protein [Mammaliicoccus sciuri]|uniref:fibrinogen-binding adhesin SdrG C-terminal domain-containing protein n=1 Tax=Mammaliicoccus sciuri TaxID=1296 RepID=UPI0021D05ACB|nr:fibrinogen-binding adhesin SdrG C-terminal domain-containing protein [Mammaliicoccus sciuri]UXV32543.1 fibrinogen-binding adhesin SdrG C-terminal domain-containing protein [Mammaliicoccus sciuri]